MAQTDYGSADFDSTTVNSHRSGTVTARQWTTAGPQVQVLYPDRGVTSDWIPVGQQGGKGAVFHFCPRVGDNVTVAHFATGIETGVVIAANSTPQNPGVKPRSLNSVALQMDDSSYFEHDPDTGCLSINGIATLYFNAKGQIKIICGGDCDVTVGGNLNASVTGNVEVTCTDLDATCSGEATVTAPTITLKGNVEITGTLKVDETLEVVGNVQFDSTGSIQTHLQNIDGDGGGS